VLVKAESPTDRLVDPDLVDEIRKTVVSTDDAQRLARHFQLLADPVRLRMVYALSEVEELCVGDLAAVVGASESGTSHQLRQLRLAGLVRTRKQGRVVYYRVADAHVRMLLDVAVDHYLREPEDHT
jgi:DNA-binding transcriptional ArsR family regulator